MVDLWNVLNFLLNSVDINIFWCHLHKDGVALFRNLNGGREHNDREHEREDWIEDLALWVVVDDNAGNDDPNGLDQVSYHVDHGCAHVQVL